MTDKQIIINRVDVSGCKFFRNGICASPINPKCKLCVEINEKMCYYKQLKRKEQECEELKSQLTSLSYADAICALEIDLEHKTQECEELKKQLMDFMNGEYCVNGCAKMQTQYKEYHTKLIEQLDQLKASKEQVEQKLKQIEKLCIKNSTKSSFCHGIENKDMQKLAIRILQIISEVK